MALSVVGPYRTGVMSDLSPQCAAKTDIGRRLTINSIFGETP
jgi:hypothetical protein